MTDWRLPELSDDHNLFGPLFEYPVVDAPMWATVAIVHQVMAGRDPRQCVNICLNVAGAMQHLGFEAEVVAACATFQHDAYPGQEVNIGVRDRPPIMEVDGRTDGHMIVYLASFQRFLDPTIAQEPSLLAAAVDQPSLALAALAPVPLGVYQEALRRERLLALSRPPYLIKWWLFPEYTQILTDNLPPVLWEAVRYGSLGLAHDVLTALNTVGRVRNMKRLHNEYPRLRELLNGRRRLPELPELSPEARQLLLGPET